MPAGISLAALQSADDGMGALFRRRYRASICQSAMSPEEVISHVGADLNSVAPTEFARFRKVKGTHGRLAVDDELVVRMPGPWNGPVRVVAVTPTTFRLATLDGHLEAGQIEFCASRREDGVIEFTIESWARR